MFSELLLLLAISLSIFYLWQKYNYTYWKRHGVPFVKPTPIVGNFMDMAKYKKSIGVQLYSLYNTKGYEKEPMVGIYLFVRPALLLRDVDLIKKVMIKDFTNFSNRLMGADPHNDPLGYNNLFFVRTPFWRELRTKLSPVFTSGKIKQMYPLMVDVGKELDIYLKSQTDGAVMEFRDICARFTTQVIGTIAFGVNCNSIQNAKSDFYLHGQAVFERSLRRAFDSFVTLVAPKFATLLRTRVFTESTTQFMRSTIGHVMGEREKSDYIRNDLIDVLVKMKRDAAADPSPTNPAKDFDFLVAQASIFHTAGFETSSSTMGFALYELAKAPQIQQRLRQEIVAAFEEHGDWISYERIQELPYLGMVIDETLRKYPILSFLERECLNSYQLTDDLKLEKGTAVYISAKGLHYDEKYWPEPHKFDPERFAPSNREKINKDAYMPFGMGPRNCIGMRLGLLQSKLGLVHLLRSHQVVECAKTQRHIVFEPKGALLAPIGGVHLELQRCG